MTDSSCRGCNLWATDCICADHPDLWRQVNLLVRHAREQGYDVAADWIVGEWHARQEEKMADTKARADEMAETLRRAGFSVERRDYEAASWEPDIGARHYVIVREGESRAEGQTNDRIPYGSFSGYGGPDGEALLARVRALL